MCRMTRVAVAIQAFEAAFNFIAIPPPVFKPTEPTAPAAGSTAAAVPASLIIKVPHPKKDKARRCT